MAARVILLLLLIFILAACGISKVIVIKADPATPIIIPQLIIIEPDTVPPFIPEFGATPLMTVTSDYPFPTSQPTVTQALPFSTQTPQPEITPSHLPPIGEGQ